MCEAQCLLAFTIIIYCRCNCRNFLLGFDLHPLEDSGSTKYTKIKKDIFTKGIFQFLFYLVRRNKSLEPQLNYLDILDWYILKKGGISKPQFYYACNPL